MTLYYGKKYYPGDIFYIDDSIPGSPLYYIHGTKLKSIATAPYNDPCFLNTKLKLMDRGDLLHLSEELSKNNRQPHIFMIEKLREFLEEQADNAN